MVRTIVLAAEPAAIPESRRDAFAAAIARTAGAGAEVRLLRGPPGIALARAAAEESAS